MIDLVCVNLYPFAETIRKPGVSFEEVIENIDIGGPSMIRAAAKNFQDVAVLTSPEDYSAVLQALQAGAASRSRGAFWPLPQGVPLYGPLRRSSGTAPFNGRAILFGELVPNKSIHGL